MRKIALKILNEYETDKGYVNLLLKSRVGANIAAVDRGFITELVYGVIRNKLYLDYIIGKYSSVKIKKLSIPLLNILRIGFYQLYFLDKVPDFAVVNECVRLAEKFCYKSKGMVNGILRTALNHPINTENVADNIKYSFPDGLFELLARQFGDNEIKNIMEKLNAKKPVIIRANRLKTTTDKLISELFTDDRYSLVDGYIITNNFKVTDSDLFDKGHYSIQSIPSQLVIEKVLTPQKNEKILDACAAPGGKTELMGELMENTGEITACELYEHRCGLIEKNLKRCGITNVKIVNRDAREIVHVNEFDRVIIDAPCSGLGVIGSKPDIKWQNHNFGELIKIQKEILESCKKALKSGGILVYSTCTINKDENINQINEFLKNNPDFKPQPFDITIDGVKYGQNGTAEIMPSQNGIGFFIAKMKRCEA